jgi:hypothetical protein
LTLVTIVIVHFSPFLIRQKVKYKVLVPRLFVENRLADGRLASLVGESEGVDQIVMSIKRVVGQMSVGQMSVGQMTGATALSQPNTMSAKRFSTKRQGRQHFCTINIIFSSTQNIFDGWRGEGLAL